MQVKQETEVENSKFHVTSRQFCSTFKKPINNKEYD
jgi:hypothetical protein